MNVPVWQEGAFKSLDLIPHEPDNGMTKGD